MLIQDFILSELFYFILVPTHGNSINVTDGWMLTSRKDLHTPNLVPPVVGYILGRRKDGALLCPVLCLPPNLLCLLLPQGKYLLIPSVDSCFLYHVVEDAQTLWKKPGVERARVKSDSVEPCRALWVGKEKAVLTGRTCIPSEESE